MVGEHLAGDFLPYRVDSPERTSDDARSRPQDRRLVAQRAGKMGMLALGSILAGVGVLLVGLLALVFRNPRAPRWTRPEAVVFLTMVPVAGMIGFGFGYVLYGAGALLHGEGDLRELAALALVPVVVALIWHVFGVRGRLRAYAEASGAAAGAVPMPAVSPVAPTDQPPESPAPGTPRRPTRRAA
jgi:hypothetical protein